MSPVEPLQHSTSSQDISRFLVDLQRSRERYAATTVGERIELAEACAEGVVAIARDWVEAACQAKSIPPTSPARAEEILAGPVAALRCLRLLVHSLRGIEAKGVPQLPGRAHAGPDGRLRVPLFPTKILFDRLVLFPLKITAWMREGLSESDLTGQLAVAYRGESARPAKTAVILGAGNVSAIPLTDTFSKLFQEGHVVLLKMSPVNAYLGPLLERALRPLIEPGYLRIAYGDAEVGAMAIEHALADEVHITGGIESHDRVVWGPSGPEHDARKQAGTPLLDKPITSELGNVSPWILGPGRYSARQLAFQAENVAASVVNNVSFNCVATKVLITWKHWPQRSQFLDLLEGVFDRTPRRVSYYPGAVERYCRVTGVPGEGVTEELPWTLRREVDPDREPQYLQHESFVCVVAEVALEAPTPERFLRRAVAFANERLTGTLCATLTLPAGFRRLASNEQLVQTCLAELRYGAIAINHWPGLMYAMMTPPWGGFPGSTLADAQSGLGWVHNTFMLDGIEKSVLEGPLTMFPKPVWFPSHQRAEPVAWSFFELYRQPSWFNLTRLLLASLRP